ncbi:hypothetical protein WN943_003642 [Citrus x changshan-huyou]
MDMSYTTWIWHGEQLGKKGIDVEMTNTYSMSRDVDDHYRGVHENVDEQQDNYPMNFVEDAEIPLYPKYTRLSAAAVLYKHKTMYGYSNKGFDNLLEILCDMLPELNTIPNSTRSEHWGCTMCAPELFEKNASRVWVDEVKNPSAELWKKYADMETIEDALGSSIAWPTEAIIVMED